MIKFLSVVAILLQVPALAVAEKRTAQEDSDLAYEGAEMFSQCAGLYDAMSEMAKQMKDDAKSQSLHETHNGAKLAAMYMASLEIPIAEARVMATQLITASKNYWLGLWGADAFISKSKDQIAICNDLMPLQVDIIRKARKEAYGFNK